MHYLLGLLVTLLKGAVPLPQRTYRRYLLVAWTLCSPVLIYQSQLLSILLTPVLGRQPIRNAAELLASDTPVRYNNFMVCNKLRERYLSRHAFRTRGSRQPPAMLRLEVTVRYLARNHTDTCGQSTQYAFAEVAAYEPLYVQFDTCTSFLHRPAAVLARLAENGLVAKFLRDVDFSGYWTPGEPKDEPLSRGHLGFAFVALLLGYALASLTFVLNVVWWWLQHGWWQPLCTAAKWCATRVQGCCRTCATGVRRRGRRVFRRWRGTFRRRVLAQLDHHQ